MNTPEPKHRAFGLMGLLGIVAIVAAMIAVHESTSARQAEESLAMATRAHQADQARMQQLARKVQAAEANRMEMEQTLQQQRSAAETAKAAQEEQAAKAAMNVGGGGADAKAKALADGQAFLSTYGQAHDMLMAIGKAQIARNYSALIRSGALTPAQIDDLETQTSEHWLQTIAVAPNAIHPTDPNLPDDQLKAILGDQGFQQMKDSQRMQPLQGMVNDISSLSVSAPLSPEQSTQLLNLLANASSSYASGGKATPQSVDWNQVMPQVQGILSDAQVSALKAESQLPQVMNLVKQFYANQPPHK